MFKNFFQYRFLIFSMIKREISMKYKGSILGILWSVITPIILVGVYTFCFSYIFKASWKVEKVDIHIPYALVLFAGLNIFTLFSEIFLRSPSLISGYSYLLKKTVFPVEVLAYVSVGSALFQLIINTSIIIFINIIVYNYFVWEIVFLPFIVLPFTVFLLAICWLLSTIGVFLKDISNLLNLLVTVLMFLSPVFFSLDSMPEPYKSIAVLNPLTLIIEETRKVLLYGLLPDFKSLSIYFLFSFCFMQLSYIFLLKVKKGFGDAI